MRHLMRAAATMAAVGLAIMVAPPAAWATDAPPDVTGLPVAEATARLTQWNKAVFFRYVPSAEAGADMAPGDVVVARSEISTDPQTGTAAVRPVATLTLGRVVPDLSGLTAAESREILDRRELRLLASPDQAPPTWTVAGQRPAPGTIVAFTAEDVVRAELTNPVVDDGGLTRPQLVAIASGGGALFLVALLGVLLLRRSAVRRGRSDADPSGVEPIEIRSYAGHVVGPDLIEGRTR
jgi:hypothetical protein